MEPNKEVALLIVKFFKKEMKSGCFDDNALSCIETATQCIESAYKITPSEYSHDNSNIKPNCESKENKIDVKLELLNNILKPLHDIDCGIRPTKPIRYKFSGVKFDENVKRVIEFDKCPAYVEENDIKTRPKLEVPTASSSKKVNLSNNNKSRNDLSTLDLNCVGGMKNLDELRLKGLSRVQLISIPLFNKLANLKTLSLTSINEFTREIYRCLETVNTNLENLELGHCNNLSERFAMLIRRFTNLKSLRLENCDKWGKYSGTIFNAIRSLKELKSLELINININSKIKYELEKCIGIQALCIIPMYDYECADAICYYIIDCLKKLSTVLNHLVWGITEESLLILNIFYTETPKNQFSTKKYKLKEKKKSKPPKNVNNQTSKEFTTDNKIDESNNKESVVSILQNYLELIMKNTKIKVIKVPFSQTTKVYLRDQFNDI